MTQILLHSVIIDSGNSQVKYSLRLGLRSLCPTSVLSLHKAWSLKVRRNRLKMLPFKFTV